MKTVRLQESFSGGLFGSNPPTRTSAKPRESYDQAKRRLLESDDRPDSIGVCANEKPALDTLDPDVVANLSEIEKRILEILRNQSMEGEQKQQEIFNEIMASAKLPSDMRVTEAAIRRKLGGATANRVRKLIESTRFHRRQSKIIHR